MEGNLNRYDKFGATYTIAMLFALQEYGGSLLYDGRFLVKTGIIVVTINYRLGAMANLLYGSGDRKIKGNYGIKVLLTSIIVESIMCRIKDWLWSGSG